jgi:hypothetical protein
MSRRSGVSHSPGGRSLNADMRETQPGLILLFPPESFDVEDQVPDPCRACGKDRGLTSIDWRGLRKGGQAGRRPRASDWHVLDVRSDVPLVAKVILHPRVAIAVGLIRWFLE